MWLKVLPLLIQLASYVLSLLEDKHKAYSRSLEQQPVPIQYPDVDKVVNKTIRDVVDDIKFVEKAKSINFSSRGFRGISINSIPNASADPTIMPDIPAQTYGINRRADQFATSEASLSGNYFQDPFTQATAGRY